MADNPSGEPIVESDWDDELDEEEELSSSAVGQAVVTDTDWTAETILMQLRRGNIDLKPRFQRRDAWLASRKSRFIESILLGFPIPQLVLAEDKSRRGAFIVLDGKQRLLALRQFAEGSELFSVDGSDDGFRNLKLTGLEVRQDLHGFDLARLEKDPNKLDDLNAILNQTIRTVVVRRWPDENFLNTVFLRLNTGTVQLSPQELRQALHPGHFSTFLDDFTADSAQTHRALRTRGPDFRMRDVELLLRYFAFYGDLPNYRGNLKRFLDDSTKTYNGRWGDGEKEIRHIAQTFEDSIMASFDIFERNAFFRWDPNKSGGRYERRFNRALFDAIMYHFRDPGVRAAARDLAHEVENGLKRLCTDDVEFVRSIQSTTKSIGATFYRISTWGKQLSAVLGVSLPTPEPAEA